MALHKGRHSRGYLPHDENPGATVFLTWRLADALPASVYLPWKSELENESAVDRRRLLAKRVEQYCDSGAGSCALKNPSAALAIQDTIFACGASICDVHAWVVMPNHVHLLCTTSPEVPLGTLVKLLKGRSAHAINKALNLTGRLWQPEYFDRAVRNPKHFHGAAKYIEWNPVKAKLCTEPAEWPYSSANPIAQERLRRAKELTPS